LHPVMPEAMQAIWSQLGLEGSPAQLNPTELKWGELKDGAKIGGVEAVFPRLDKEKIMSEINAGVPASAPETQPEPPMTHATEADAVGVTSFIEIDDFAKVELRVGQVLSA